jgi:hypothetical protein
MSTGNFENWAGNIVDIGPIYPFVGTEFVLFIVGVVSWLVWHVVQTRRETKEWEEDLKKFGGKQLPGEEYFDH